MNIFGGSIREFLGMAVVCALLGWLAWHEHGVAASADARCDTRLAVQVGNENAATATDQHTADTANIAALQKQIQQLQSDAEYAAALKTQLQARLHDQQEVLHHVLASAKAGDCLHQRVPAALVGSLYAGAEHSAQPPG